MKNKQMSDSFFLGILLAIVGGFLDAYSYVLRGGVFANAQTGNIVLLGLSIAEGNTRKALYYLVPVLAFVLGVVVSDVVKKKYKENQSIHWRQVSVLIEVIALLFAGFIPVGSLNMLANVLISFVCAVQVESFRKMNGLAYATTMCTGNLRSGTEQLYRYKATKDIEAGNKCLKYYSIILFFIIGAIGGMSISLYLGVKAIWICCLILSSVFVVMMSKNG
ncbi:MAG: YoaK family protein [Caulobacteraceae bacterium]